MSKVRLAAMGRALAAASQRVAVAESSAGGLICSRLLEVHGASKFFAGGLVVYTKASKRTFLGLDDTSSKPTATEAHAIELAEAARERLGVDWAIGETGVAGPTPNSRGIAPGVCGIAVVGPGVRKSQTLWPDDSLGADDAYGQAPKLSRPESMEVFASGALELLLDAVETALPGHEAK